MNMNEVLANRASEILGGERGEGRLVHPNDDVNRGQSSQRRLPDRDARGRGGRDASSGCCPRSTALRATLATKKAELRRHREDRPHAPAGRDAAHARPGVLGLRRAARPRARATSRPRSAHLSELALGGTAVGTGLNAPPRVRRARGRGALAAHRLRVRDRAQQVRGARDATTRWCTRTAR